MPSPLDMGPDLLNLGLAEFESPRGRQLSVDFFAVDVNVTMELLTSRRTAMHGLLVQLR